MCSVNRTFAPTSDKAKLMEKLEHVAEELEEDAAHGSWAGRTITLKYKLDTHQSKSYALISDDWFIIVRLSVYASQVPPAVYHQKRGYTRCWTRATCQGAAPEPASHWPASDHSQRSPATGQRN